MLVLVLVDGHTSHCTLHTHTSHRFAEGVPVLKDSYAMHCALHCALLCTSCCAVTMTRHCWYNRSTVVFATKGMHCAVVSAIWTTVFCLLELKAEAEDEDKENLDLED